MYNFLYISQGKGLAFTSVWKLSSNPNSSSLCWLPTSIIEIPASALKGIVIGETTSEVELIPFILESRSNSLHHTIVLSAPTWTQQLPLANQILTSLHYGHVVG